MSRIKVAENTPFNGPEYYTAHGVGNSKGNEDWITIKTMYGNFTGMFSNLTTVIEKAPLTKPFNFSATAQYTEFGSFNGGSGAKRVAAGIRESERTMGYDHVSRSGNLQHAKVYQGSKTNDFSFEFRVFENGTYNSITPFMFFVAATYPKMDEATRKVLIDRIKNQADNTGVLGYFANLATGTAGNIAQVFRNLWGNLNAEDNSNVVGEWMRSRNTEDFSIADYFSAMNGLDKTFIVEVGNLVRLKNLVLNSFNATFSRERRHFINEVDSFTMPIYIDYSINLSPVIEPTRGDVIEWFKADGVGNYVVMMNIDDTDSEREEQPKFNDETEDRKRVSNLVKKEYDKIQQTPVLYDMGD